MRNTGKASSASRALSFVMALVMTMSMMLGTVVSQPTAAYADQATATKVSVDGDKQEKGGAEGRAVSNDVSTEQVADGENQSVDENDGTDQKALSQKDKEDDDEKDILQVVIEAVGGFFGGIIDGVTDFVTGGVKASNAVTEQDLENGSSAALITILRNDPAGSDASGPASLQITVQNSHSQFPDTDWDDLSPWAVKVYDDANGSVSSTSAGAFTLDSDEGNRTMVYNVSVEDGGKLEFYAYQWSNILIENTSAYHMSMNGLTGYTSTTPYTISGETWSSPYIGNTDMTFDYGFKSTPKVASNMSIGHATVYREDPAGSSVGAKSLSSIQVTMPATYTAVSQFDEQSNFVGTSSWTATVHSSDGTQKGTVSGTLPAQVYIETTPNQTAQRVITYDMSGTSLVDGDYVVVPVVNGSEVKAFAVLEPSDQLSLISSENTTVTEGDDYRHYFTFSSTGETSITIGYSELTTLPKTSFKLVRQDANNDLSNKGSIKIDLTLPSGTSFPSESSDYMQANYMLYLYSNEAALDADASSRSNYYGELYPNIITESNGEKHVEYEYSGFNDGMAIGFDLVTGATIDIYSASYAYSVVSASGVTPSVSDGQISFVQPNAAVELDVALSMKPMATMPLSLTRDDLAFGDDTAGTFTSATLDLYLEGYTTSTSAWETQPYADPANYPLYLYQSASDANPTTITPTGSGQTMTYTFDMPDGAILSGDAPKVSSGYFSAGSNVPSGSSVYFRQSDSDPASSYVNDLITSSGLSGKVGVHATASSSGIRIARPSTDTYDGTLPVVVTIPGVETVPPPAALLYYDGDTYNYDAISPVVTTSGGVSTATYSFNLPKHSMRDTWVAVNWKYDANSGVPTVTVGATLPAGKLLQFDSGAYITSGVTNNGNNSYSFSGSITRPSSLSFEEPWSPQANLTVIDDPNYDPGSGSDPAPIETTTFTMTREDPAGSENNDPIQLEMVEELPSEIDSLDPTDYPMTVSDNAEPTPNETTVNPTYDSVSDPNTLTYTASLDDGDSVYVPLIQGSKFKMRPITPTAGITKTSGEGTTEDGWITFDVDENLAPTTIEAANGDDPVDPGNDPGNNPGVSTEGSITLVQNAAINSGTTYDAYRVFQGPVSTVNGEDKASTLTWAVDNTTKTAILSFLDSNGYNVWLTDAGNATLADHDNPMLAAQFISEKIADTTASPTAVAASGNQPRTTTGTSFATGLAAVLVANGTTQASDATSGVAYQNEQGYYLFVSDPNAIDGQDEEAGTAPVWAAISSTPKTVAEKVAVPTLTKQVQDDASGATFGKAADANIGQDLAYKLTATMPENVMAYPAYGMTFTDTLPAGMTLAGGNTSSVAVTLDETDVTSLCTITYANDVLTVVASNLMDESVATAGATLSASSTLVVDYQAHLDADYAQGSSGNANAAVLSYSADPMDAASQTPTVSQTPQQSTYTYAHTLSVEKVDRETRLAMSGVQFTIQDNASGRYVALDGTLSSNAVNHSTNSNGVIEIAGVDSGTYTVHEVAAPTGYKALPDFTVAVAPTYTAAGGIDTYGVSATGDNFSSPVAPATTVGANEDGIAYADGTNLKFGVRISNLREIVLPLTGMPLGMGIAVYGSILAAVSLVLYIRNKRIKDQIAELEDMAA